MHLYHHVICQPRIKLSIVKICMMIMKITAGKISLWNWLTLIPSKQNQISRKIIYLIILCWSGKVYKLRQEAFCLQSKIVITISSFVGNKVLMIIKKQKIATKHGSVILKDIGTDSSYNALIFGWFEIWMICMKLILIQHLM